MKFFKKTKFAHLIPLLLIFLHPAIEAQSLMPADSGNWLQNANKLNLGDQDEINVIFFEIPDTTTSTLYFGVRDSETNNFPPDQLTTGGSPSALTDFYLIGGSGSLSDANSRKINYSGIEAQSRTGTQLSYFQSTNVGPDAGTWHYFPQGVSPSQGEHIGNKYYFKIVVDMTASSNAVGEDYKNAYQLDVSLSGVNGQAPAGVPDAKSFAYHLCFDLANGFPAWNLYPFIPDNALTTDTVNFYNYDFDTDGTIHVYDKVPEAERFPAPNASIDGATESQGYTVNNVAERNGTWRYNFVSSSGSTQNASEVWVDLNGTTPLRLYSSAINTPPAADHVVVNYTDGQAVANDADTETMSLQVVDASGDPVNTVKNIYVALTDGGANPANIVSVNGAAFGPAAAALIATDVNGLASYQIRRNHDGTPDNDSYTVTSTVYWNGTGSSTDFGTSSFTTKDVVFSENPDPTISSASNQDFTVGAGATTLDTITINHPSLAVSPKIVNSGTWELQIRIPAGLDAVFRNFAPTLGGGAVAKVGATSFSGDFKTLRIEVTANFTTGDSITVTNLDLENFGSASGGGWNFPGMEGLILMPWMTSISPSPIRIWISSGSAPPIIPGLRRRTGAPTAFRGRAAAF